jgi:mannose-6-phosphate isomerase-like protein (cupin superfamily)
MPQTRLARSVADEAALTGSLRSTATSLQAEQFESDAHGHLDEVVPKPWGYEFRVYADDLYDVWKLCLQPGQSTSVHCHPRKETALLCLAGSGHMTFLAGQLQVARGDVAFIGKGVFHGTDNTGAADLHLVEVEVPRNKYDLVRLRDRYGRQGTAYETERRETDALLLPGRLTPRSKFRASVRRDRFRFGVRAGLDVVTRPDPDLMFAVSLSVGDALDHAITVLPASFASSAVADEQLYLTISAPDTQE